MKKEGGRERERTAATRSRRKPSLMTKSFSTNKPLASSDRIRTATCPRKLTCVMANTKLASRSKIVTVAGGVETTTEYVNVSSPTFGSCVISVPITVGDADVYGLYVVDEREMDNGAVATAPNKAKSESRK